MALTLKNFNRRLAAQGLELVQGDGYLYFITLPPYVYQSYSVYVCRFSQLTPEQWLEEAKNVDVLVTLH